MTRLLVDKDKLEDWIINNFHEYKDYHGDYLVHSPFKEDHKFKLSISIEKQCYHCWKTDKSGPLWKLVSEINSCSKQEALEQVYNVNNLSQFNNTISSLKDKANKVYYKEPSKETISFPPYTYPISTESNNKYNIIALEYCINRKINPIKWNIHYCNNGKYSGRIIIPFYNNRKKLIYWVSRALFNQEPKYLNPPKELVKKEDVIFSNEWEFKKDVFLTEGCIDTISLLELGFNSISIQGAVTSEKQLQLIQSCNYYILAFDNDKPGTEAIYKNYLFLRDKNINNIYYIQPPNPFKDWNSAFINIDNNLKKYIVNNVKKFNLKSEVEFKLKINI